MSMKVPATAILFLLTMDCLGNPCSTTTSAQTMPLTCRYITYYFFLTAIVAGTGVCSSVAIPISTSVTAFPSEFTFGFIFMSVTAPNWCRLLSSGCFSSILLTPGPYITKTSLTRSIPTSLVSVRTYIIILRMLFPAGILMLILLAAILFFL